ncbi:unnamed protein product [Paramecium sonneborni]|uniref:Uncharacterized protein n=1 Tax=Paramecium sonneborni TaxID=65129 RepID=A0A8S1RJD7_9CILI|nr:unnamed protein product [Paramecium sonneborni]
MNNQSNVEQFDFKNVEQEPKIQQIKSIRVQANRYYTQKQQEEESESLDTLQSVFNSEQELKGIFESLSNISTTNTIKLKKKKQKGVYNGNSFKTRLAKKTKMQSFRLEEEACSQDEEESLPQNLIDVDLQFREEAIFSVQKIIESRKKLQ